MAFLALDFVISPYCWKGLEYLERVSLLVLLLTFQAANLSHSEYFNSMWVEIFIATINLLYIILFCAVTKGDVNLLCDNFKSKVIIRKYNRSF